MLSLEILNLSHNELSGSIPNTFNQMLSLTSVDISYNQLEGPLPSNKDFRELQQRHLQIIKACVATSLGAFGSVYRAKLQSGQVVAVKKLQALENDDGVASLKTLTSEVQALTDVRHRNIVRLLGFCLHPRHAFLVYEFMERGSLEKMPGNDEAATQFGWIERVNVIKGIVNALAYLHHDCSPPIIHRDISSKNILLDSEHEAILSNFGIARLLEARLIQLDLICRHHFFGSHPGDFITFLSTSTSSSSTAHHSLLKDVLDQRLSQPMNEVAEDVVFMMKLALACLLSSPQSRPTIQQASQQLSDQKQPLPEGIHTITFGQLSDLM
ncbi:MDIS1-interacting receptor like kinase 2-like [Cornus florida]|uniref:MDIS1-interacting receptor like kinase 2-like n=1 Tax=Cornus florida TaxID=4283 RepID=UPI0028975FDB|nr:MDIS1-interacting receptor like kinase 2-like [Cornus florida]